MRVEEIYNHKHKLSGTPLAIRSLYLIPGFVFTLFSDSLIFNASIALLYLTATLILTEIRIKKILKLSTYPILFIVLGCFTIAFSFNSSSPFFTSSQWDIGFDSENLMLAYEIVSRSVAIICIVCLGLLTHTISEISETMRFFRIPHLFIEIFILTYKFIFTLYSVSRIMYTAQLSRLGYLSKRNNIKAFTLLSSAIFRKAIQQSNHLAIAIDARSGNGNFYFVSIKNCFKAKQLLAPILLLSLLSVLFIIFNTHG